MNPDPDEHVYPGHEELQWGEGIKVKHRGMIDICIYMYVFLDRVTFYIQNKT